ncbi:MAG: OapB/ArvB family protein [Nanobdellota archaeon]
MGLTLQFVPHSEIQNLSPVTKINKLLKMAKDNNIVVLEGRLKKEEETELIRVTMEEIDDEFKGVEMSVIYPQSQDKGLFDKIKANLANMLLGDRMGLTIIGPATIVKEIKKDPSKIQLLTKELRKKS